MRRVGWIVLLAVVAFVAIVIANIPAVWVIPANRPEGSCANLDGSLWNGSCGGLKVYGQALGDMSWRLHPLKLFTGALAAHVTLAGPLANATGELALHLGGRIDASNLSGDMPLDPRVLSALPRSLSGRAHLDLAQAQLQHGVIKELKGRIEAHDLIEHSGGNATLLGSYEITFPGGDDLTGKLRDTDGPLAVEGTLKLTPAPGFELEGFIAPRNGAPAEVVNNIQFFGSPDASGRRPFSLSGTF